MRNIDTGKAQIRKIILEVRYPTGVEFFRKRGELIAASESENVSVSLHENRIDVDDRTNKCAKRIGFFSSSITSEYIQTPGGFLIDVAGHWLDKVLSILSVERLRRVGVRQQIIYPWNGQFEKLVAECRTQMIFIKSPAWEKIGGEPSDIGLPLDFEFSDYAAHLMIGPMKREQMGSSFDNTEGLPDVGLFLDWDYYTREVSRTQLREFLRDVKDHVEKRIGPFRDSLKEQ